MDSSTLVIYGIVIIGFLVQDKLGKVQFLKKTFLLIDTSMEVILGILFLTFFNIDIWFAKKSMNRGDIQLHRFYPTPKRLSSLIKRNLWL